MRTANSLTTCGLVILAAVFTFGQAAPARSESTISRSEVEKAIAEGMTPEEIDKKYGESTAVDDVTDPGEEGKAALKIDTFKITNTGSTGYEALQACSYHPQREELTCTVEIRQRFGYGGRICNASGSTEFVHFCVDYGAGLVPVHINGFHIHDEMFGVQPAWYFSAVVQSDWRLLSQPNNGRTLKARAILAWNQVLGGGGNYCNLRPIWGNQADFNIRLDP